MSCASCERYASWGRRRACWGNLGPVRQWRPAGGFTSTGLVEVTELAGVDDGDGEFPALSSEETDLGCSDLNLLVLVVLLQGGGGSLHLSERWFGRSCDSLILHRNGVPVVASHRCGLGSIVLSLGLSRS